MERLPVSAQLCTDPSPPHAARQIVQFVCGTTSRTPASSAVHSLGRSRYRWRCIRLGPHLLLKVYRASWRILDPGAATLSCALVCPLSSPAWTALRSCVGYLVLCWVPLPGTVAGFLLCKLPRSPGGASEFLCLCLCLCHQLGRDIGGRRYAPADS